MSTACDADAQSGGDDMVRFSVKSDGPFFHSCSPEQTPKYVAGLQGVLIDFVLIDTACRVRLDLSGPLHSFVNSFRVSVSQSVIE